MSLYRFFVRLSLTLQYFSASFLYFVNQDFLTIVSEFSLVPEVLLEVLVALVSDSVLVAEVLVLVLAAEVSAVEVSLFLPTLLCWKHFRSLRSLLEKLVVVSLI